MALLPQLLALLSAEAEHIKGSQAREPLGVHQQAGSSDGRGHTVDTWILLQAFVDDANVVSCACAVAAADKRSTCIEAYGSSHV